MVPKIINPTIVNLVKRYKTAVSEKIPVQQLIVFGSQVKGTAKPWSDIDVCVVSPQFGHDYHAERVSLMNIRNTEFVDIEPHPYHPNDLKDKWDGLAAEIRRTGIPV